MAEQRLDHVDVALDEAGQHRRLARIEGAVRGHRLGVPATYDLDDAALIDQQVAAEPLIVGDHGQDDAAANVEVDLAFHLSKPHIHGGECQPGGRFALEA